MLHKHSNNKGFSLVELIIIIAIMAILASSLTIALVRYITRARKAVDVQNAELIYNAAYYAMSGGSEGAMKGWYETDQQTGGKTKVTDEKGYQYYIVPVTWCRGIDFNGWENASFKIAHDQSNFEKYWVNEFLMSLYQESAKDGVWTGKGKQYSFNGKTFSTIEFRYRKAQNGKAAPECWIVYRRLDNDMPEVWIGHKSGSVQPDYRIYPDTCAEYRDN